MSWCSLLLNVRLLELKAGSRLHFAWRILILFASIQDSNLILSLLNSSNDLISIKVLFLSHLVYHIVLNAFYFFQMGTNGVLSLTILIEFFLSLRSSLAKALILGWLLLPLTEIWDILFWNWGFWVVWCLKVNVGFFTYDFCLPFTSKFIKHSLDLFFIIVLFYTAVTWTRSFSFIVCI